MQPFETAANVKVKTCGNLHIIVFISYCSDWLSNSGGSMKKKPHQIDWE